MFGKAIACVPASTTNLGPGFDVLGLALKLYSTVEIEETDSGVRIIVHGVDQDKIPTSTDNLAFESANYIFQRVGYQPKGIKLTITNGIPAIRGLGGSGTAILGGLLSANAICGDPFSPDQILDFAVEREGHPDNITASLLGGLTVAVVDKKNVKAVKLSPPEDLRVVIAIPDYTLSTKEAREVLPQNLDLKSAIYNVSRSSLLVAAVATGKLDMLNVAMQDLLHQPHRAKLIPGFEDVCNSAIQAGALSAALSGAGPSIAAYCITSEDQIANVMIDAFAENGLNAEAKILEVDSAGATVSLHIHSSD
ncbi:TPA: homoserine kinase [Candidatus Poribacteria bacterium]|jgi:homoserine kinase|nr:homoserine kinase [Candidatus Poribacteria bacterium]